MDLNLDFNADQLNNDNHYDVVVIGGGSAGATAPSIPREPSKTLVIDKGLTAGALGLTAKIANYPGVPGEISGADLLKIMREQAQSFGAIFTADKVQAVDLTSEVKTIFSNGGTYTAQAVIIATGSMGRGQRVKGEDELLGRGVSYCATCDAAFFRDQVVAVAGNSDEAIEEASFLTKFVRHVHFLSPTPNLKAEPHLVEEITSQSKVTVHFGTALREVIGTNRVEAVRAAQRGQPEVIIPVTGAFIYLQGGKPITDFLQQQLPISESGCLVVDKEYQTALPGVYAVGDVLCNHVKQAVIAAAEGAVAAIAIEKQLHHRKQLVADWAK
jgi:thioredoxin reductase (NADPH)